MILQVGGVVAFDFSLDRNQQPKWHDCVNSQIIAFYFELWNGYEVAQLFACSQRRDLAFLTFG